MKKFKLYGKKDNFEGVLATVYAKDGKVVVESEDPVVKEILETEIDKAMKTDGGEGLKIEEIVKLDPSKYAVDHLHTTKFVRVSDNDFIKAIAFLILTQYTKRDKNSNLIFNFRARMKDLGYQIFYGESHIVEE
jgi:hypothetical protein